MITMGYDSGNRVAEDKLPRARVVYLPGDHDYLRALYGTMSSARSGPAKAIIPIPRPEGQEPPDLADFGREADVVHINWPERLVSEVSRGCDGHVSRTFQALDAIERSGALVAWTMHNRVPHFWPAAAGVALYCRMATLATAIIHHSTWGMGEMIRRLHYRADAVHARIPHGHYGEALRIEEDRAECERRLGLTPSALRFGIIGRPQSQKRVASIARAFLSGAGPDLQLLVTAVGPDEIIPADRRIAVRPRSGWLTREEIATQVKCCDCLVAWHGGASYLTSGLVADAVGAGIPMLVNGDWPFWSEILGDAAFTYIGEEGLGAAFANLTPAEIRRGAIAAKALRTTYNWSQIAEQTARLFLRVVANRAQ